MDRKRTVREKGTDYRTYLKNYPDKDGRFGAYGGAYLTEELISTSEEIADAYQTICHSSQFINELRRIRKELQGRPIPVCHCERPPGKIENCQIYLKREDLNHTGVHKLNYCMGEGPLVKFTGKKCLITETGAGQHGVALATAAAFFGLECEIHTGEVDIAKQASNVIRMKISRARVVPVTHDLKTLKEAVDSASGSYARNYKDSIYCIGSALGSHPFLLMVRDSQSVVGYEAGEQFLETTGMMPDEICACVGGGSNSISMFIPFLDDPVGITGVESLGRGETLGDHVASMKLGEKGIIHGSESIILKDKKGEPALVYSIASGLDYPSVGPKHALLHNLGRVEYDMVSDEEAMEAFFRLSKYEGITPVVESPHVVAYAMHRVKEMRQGSILACLGGRGDKDVDYAVEHYGYGDQFMDQFGGEAGGSPV